MAGAQWDDMAAILSESLRFVLALGIPGKACLQQCW
jgi:hypothetical protein